MALPGIDASIALGRPVFAHASLLHAGIDWLERASARSWSTPDQVVGALEMLLFAG